MQGLTLRQALLDQVPARLEEIPAGEREAKPVPSQSSPSEDLGHLLDSAANNHQRVVPLQLEDNPAMPGYDGNRWVELHRYQQRDWTELIGLWKAFNQQHLAAKAVPASAWSRACTIADSDRLTSNSYLKIILTM
jgi:hypothetical protein